MSGAASDEECVQPDLQPTRVKNQLAATARAACSDCGCVGRTAREVADLSVSWLIPAPTSATGQATLGSALPGAPAGGLVEARFCRDCAPRGRVEEVACSGCGDGPLLPDELTEPDLAVAAAIDKWLEGAGWRSAGPWCPACSKVVRPRR